MIEGRAENFIESADHVTALCDAATGWAIDKGPAIPLLGIEMWK
jgi:hypothetical protein